MSSITGNVEDVPQALQKFYAKLSEEGKRRFWDQRAANNARFGRMRSVSDGAISIAQESVTTTNSPINSPEVKSPMSDALVVQSPMSDAPMELSPTSPSSDSDQLFNSPLPLTQGVHDLSISKQDGMRPTSATAALTTFGASTLASASAFTDRRATTTTAKRIPRSLLQTKRKSTGAPDHERPARPTPGAIVKSRSDNALTTAIAQPSTAQRPAAQTATSQPFAAQPSTWQPTTAQLLAGEFRLPDWYRNVDIGAAARNRSMADRLTNFRELIKKSTPEDAAIVQKIRDELRKLEHFEVDDAVVKKSRLLEPGVGLPVLCAYPGKYPYDVEADSRALYNKWRRRDFNPDIMRGISTKSGQRSTNFLDPNYPNRINGSNFGENDLVNGQWWPLQLAALRDGAHGVSQGGIHGKKGHCAYSVLMSGGSASHGAAYEDEDYGDTVLYCGTVGENGQKTDVTEMLMDNIKSGEAVRLLRTAGMPESSTYRPSLGLRYDGLYNVISYELLDAKTALYRFRLERQRDQGPIRHEHPYARPSVQDIEAYNNHKGLRKAAMAI